MLRLGVLVSGRGSNLQAIIQAIREQRLNAEIALVVSNKPQAIALQRAAEAHIPTLSIPHRHYPSRELFDQALVDVLRQANAEWIVLAGFMRVLTPVFVRAFPHRIVNIHPALLPAFPGVHAQRQALAYGVKVSGCTVHLIDEGVDTGPILAQRAVPVLERDDEETLAARILEQEHALLVETLQAIADDRVVVSECAGIRPRVSMR